MTAPGQRYLPPRVAIAPPATACPSWSPAAGFRRLAAAGSRARSIAAVRLRSRYRSARPRRAVAAGSPATAVRAPGAVSSPATVAAAPGRRRGAKAGSAAGRPFYFAWGCFRNFVSGPRGSPTACRFPGLRCAASGERIKTKTARQIIWRAVCNLTNSNQRGASTITTWRPSKRASCSTLAYSATSALTLSSSLVPIS